MKVIPSIISANFLLLFMSIILAQDFLILQFPQLRVQFERSLVKLSKLEPRQQVLERGVIKTICEGFIRAKIFLQDNSMLDNIEQVRLYMATLEMSPGVVELFLQYKKVHVMCCFLYKYLRLYFIKDIHSENRFFVVFTLNNETEVEILGLAEPQPTTLASTDVKKEDVRKCIRKELQNEGDINFNSVKMNVKRFSTFYEEEAYRLCVWIFIHVYHDTLVYQTYVVEKLIKTGTYEKISIIKADKSTEVYLLVERMTCKIKAFEEEAEISIIPHPLTKTDVFMIKKSQYERPFVIKYIHNIPEIPNGEDKTAMKLLNKTSFSESGFHLFPAQPSNEPLSISFQTP